MPTPPSDTPVKPNRPRQGRWFFVLAAFAELIWSLPRPLLHDVVVDAANEPGSTPPTGRLAFRTAELLSEFSGKGSLADETELSGPCFGDDGQTLYFSRARPGQRADIVRSTLGEERWSKPETVRELNSVDDDRRLTMSADGRTAVLASNRSGGHGGFDIYESANDGNRWSRPRNAGATINTDAAEFDPALASDGLTMFFVRVAPGEKADLFVARRESLDAAWSPPQPVESVNSVDFHERSPAVSPDGHWLLFASNRGGRSSEPAPFSFFRAPLRDGQVGTAERMRDGIASEADDLDAAFSPDGRSLAFVSKRDGAKQLFLSRSEFVVTRLTISTAHLDQFGRARWGIPFVGFLFFLLVWRWSRRAPAAAVIVPAVIRPVTAAPKRSEPLKNPLASWTITAPAEAPPAAKPVNPLVASAKLSSETAPPPVVPLKLEPVRPGRRRLVVAVVVIAAGLLFALRTTIWNQRPVADTLRMIELDSLAVVTFLEFAPLSAAELTKLDRFDTLQRNAPQPIAPPSNTVALRPAARWPNDRVVVRQRSEVARLSDIEPPQSQSTRLAILVRHPLPSELIRPTARPPEAATVAAVAPESEKPHAAALITTVQQTFVTSATERTTVPPAAANQAALRAPARQVTQLAPASAHLLSATDVPRLTALARSGATSRIVAASNLAEPGALAGLTAITASESPLPTQSLSVPRSETLPIGKLSTPSDMAARSLLPPNRTVSNAAGLSVSSPAVNASTTTLPAKSPAIPKAAPLTEEVALPAASASPETINSNAANSPPRVESPGPLPNLPTTLFATNTARTDIATLLSPSRIESTESSARTPESRVAPTIARRDSRLPVIAVAAAESAAGPMPGSPAILLTSSTMLVELLTSATMTPLPRTESSGPAPTVASSSVSEFARWLLRVAPLTVLGSSRSEGELRPATTATSLPRQTRTFAPAELPEAP